MTPDELRAKFEMWCADHARNLSLRKGSERVYWYADTLQAWELWLAAHASLNAEVEALRKDAERYRLLRSCSGYQAPFCVTQNIGHDWIIVRREELDEAIDAAMQEKQP